MVWLRGCRAAIAVALLVAHGCGGGGDEPGGPGGADDRFDTAAADEPAVDVELLPADGLMSLAVALRTVSDADMNRCPGYAVPARRALTELAESAHTAAEGLEPSSAADAVSGFGAEAAGVADALAELEPGPSRAARRHLELTAAVRDLADGFSALADQLGGDDHDAARAAVARTENALDNVELATDEVTAACR